MLYQINDKCYVNISPRIYVEVVVSKDGKITPTKNKIEVGGNDIIRKTTIEEQLKKLVKIEEPKVEVKETKPKFEEYKSKFKRKR